MRTVAVVLLSGCSSILGIDDFKLGDGGTGNEMAEEGYCLGPQGWRICVPAAPTEALTISSSLNFTTDDSPRCTLQQQPASWKASAHPDACFFAYTNVTINAPIVRATGSRPLVIFASDTITIDTQLDVASHVSSTLAAPGSPSTLCTQPVAAMNGSSAGGGAGGSFMTKGGEGGQSSSNVSGGRAGAADSQRPTILRGGCAGGAGGNSTAMGGRPGAGGGAVYLVAGNRITINGFINASGSAGQGGSSTYAGGGGGGAGGMIHLHAPAIGGNGGVLVANGGGGGEGADGGNLPGANGSDPPPQMPAMIPVGGNGQSVGGVGGNGFAGTTNATSGGAGSPTTAAAGGGGGGASGYIRANVAPSQVASSPAVTIVP